VFQPLILSDNQIVGLTFLTKTVWSKLGLQPKVGARPMMLPFIATSKKNRHIKNVQTFASTDVEPKRLPELPGRYKPYERRKHFVWYRQGYGAARNQLQRMMDMYWWTPPIGPMNSSAGDFDVVAPRTKVIYPPSLFKGRKVEIKEKVCIACDKVFKAKRKDAKYCGTACRKWASRRVTDNCSFSTNNERGNKFPSQNFAVPDPDNREQMIFPKGEPSSPGFALSGCGTLGFSRL
jgi:hypothetical protein